MDYSRFIVDNLESHRLAIRKFCHTRLAPNALSYLDDAEQNVIHRAIKFRSSFVPSKPDNLSASLDAWLSTISFRVCADIYHHICKTPLYEKPPHTLDEAEEHDIEFGRDTKPAENVTQYKTMQSEVCIGVINKIYGVPVPPPAQLAATLKLVADMDYPAIAFLLNYVYPGKFSSLVSALNYARKSVSVTRTALRSVYTPQTLIEFD